MHSRRQLLSTALLSAALLGGSSLVASAHEEDRAPRDSHAVFVQTDDLTGNHVLAYRRASDGSLTLTGTYATGGKGAHLNGAQVDPLASQGSLTYDRESRLLIGVNAGSDSVYAFHVDGDRLSDRQVLPSDGPLPVSVTAQRDLAYVVNAGGAGSVHGYRIDDGHLSPIFGSSRSLRLATITDATQFLNTPGQIGFTPDGEHLIVTTKANGNHIDVFGVREDGRLSTAPVMNMSATGVPFGFTFDPRGQLVVSEAAASTTATYAVHADGRLSTLGLQADGQAALCWIAGADGNFFGTNAGSGTVSGFHVDASGTPTLLGSTAVGKGPIDLRASSDGEFLYVQLGGAGAVAELAVADNGALTLIGTIQTQAGQEGIATT